MIYQGDIYWAQSDRFRDSVQHPYVIVQDNILNHSRIDTVVACALTSNLKRITTPGNVLLEAGEANLPLFSVVEVSKVTTLHKAQLGGCLGSLSEHRIQQILAGMRFLQRSMGSQC